MTGGASVRLPSATEQLALTTSAIALGSSANDFELMTGGGSNLPVDLFVASP